MIGTNVFYDKFTINLKRQPTKDTSTHVKVRESYFPKDGAPQSKVTTYKHTKVPVSHEPIISTAYNASQRSALR